MVCFAHARQTFFLRCISKRHASGSIKRSAEMTEVVYVTDKEFDYNTSQGYCVSSDSPRLGSAKGRIVLFLSERNPEDRQ